MLGERSYLNGSGKRAGGVHLVISLVFLLIPVAITIAVLAADRGSAEHLMPWSTSSVGWAALKGDFSFSLTKFSLCRSGDTSSCTLLRYDDQALLKERNDIQSSGNAIMWMMGISAVLVIIASGFTFWSLVKREGAGSSRGVKIATWIMAAIASLLLFISAIVWSNSMHDKLSKYTELHYSWGFALAIVGGISCVFATILQCLRPTPADSYANV